VPDGSTRSLSAAITLAVGRLIKPFEGYAREVEGGACRSYPDPGSHGAPWTIGWGSTGPDVKQDTVWSREQAEKRLRHDVSEIAAELINLSPGLLTATDERVAALISFAYNLGLGNYRKSTLKMRVDANDWVGAQREIVKWNRASGRVMAGLVRRREAEAVMMK